MGYNGTGFAATACVLLAGAAGTWNSRGTPVPSPEPGWEYAQLYAQVNVMIGIEVQGDMQWRLSTPGCDTGLSPIAATAAALHLDLNGLTGNPEIIFVNRMASDGWELVLHALDSDAVTGFDQRVVKVIRSDWVFRRQKR